MSETIFAWSIFFIVFALLSISANYYYSHKNDVRVFPGRYKIKKHIEEGNIGYYTLFSLDFSIFGIHFYKVVGDYSPDSISGVKHFVAYKFNSVYDAEVFYESSIKA